MYRSARGFKVQLLVETVGDTIEDEIEVFLSANPTVIIIDIKFAIMPMGDLNEVYREALVIYKEAESDVN